MLSIFKILSEKLFSGRGFVPTTDTPSLSILWRLAWGWEKITQVRITFLKLNLKFKNVLSGRERRGAVRPLKKYSFPRLPDGLWWLTEELLSQFSGNGAQHEISRFLPCSWCSFSVMVKWAYDLLQANACKILVNDSEMSVWSYEYTHFAIIDEHFTIINEPLTSLK